MGRRKRRRGKKGRLDEGVAWRGVVGRDVGRGGRIVGGGAAVDLTHDGIDARSCGGLLRPVVGSLTLSRPYRLAHYERSSGHEAVLGRGTGKGVAPAQEKVEDGGTRRPCP